MVDIPAGNYSQLDNRYRTTIIIYSAQIFTVIILISVGLFVVGSENSNDSNSLAAFWVAIIFIAVGAFVLRRRFLQRDRLKNIKLLKGVSGLLATLQSNTIVLGALAELIAIIGLFVTVSSGIKADMLRAGAVSLVVFFINFPRKSVWEKIVGSLEQI